MNILAIETTGAKPSVALIRENEDAVVIFTEEELNHLQNLIPMTDEIIQRTGVKFSEITAIAISVGPGSFTGIRIGISTAKALAQVFNLRIIPVPTLLAMAYSSKKNQDGEIICPMIDARRGQVYGGAFIWENGQLKEIIKCECIMKEELMEIVNNFSKVTGTNVLFIDEVVKSAKLIGELGLEIYMNEGAKSLYEIHPDYMRKSEAEQKLIEKREICK
jgi:tRNA threonylcarbamoyladenosine biosynthesis protein TsaB